MDLVGLEVRNKMAALSKFKKQLIHQIKYYLLFIILESDGSVAFGFPCAPETNS